MTAFIGYTRPRGGPWRPLATAARRHEVRRPLALFAMSHRDHDVRLLRIGLDPAAPRPGRRPAVTFTRY